MSKLNVLQVAVCVLAVVLLVTEVVIISYLAANYKRSTSLNPGNVFEVVYYINLSHRKDRRQHIRKQLNKLNWLEHAHRIEGVRTPNMGQLGCLLSHILTLKTFLDSSYKTALILEDDCTFRTDPRPQLLAFHLDHPSTDDWDVLQLAGNTARKTAYKPYAIQVVQSMTTSAYIVTRKAALELLEAWENTVESVVKTLKPECDVSWFPLQQRMKWFCLDPCPGHQLPGFSDIQKRVMDYKGV